MSGHCLASQSAYPRYLLSQSSCAGAFFFYNLPPQLLAGHPTVAAVQTLISSQQSNATTDPTRLFQTLTNDCAVRCGESLFAATLTTNLITSHAGVGTDSSQMSSM